jgi:hypothetical protein
MLWTGLECKVQVRMYEGAYEIVCESETERSVVFIDQCVRFGYVVPTVSFVLMT